MQNTIKECTVQELYEVVKANDNLQIIDVREDYEYETVRIKDSILVPLSIFDQVMDRVDKNKTAYMLCGIGKRAMIAAERLSEKGYKDLVVIDGGIKAWINEGYSVETGAL